MFAFSGCDSSTSDAGDLSYVTLTINPQVEMTVSEDNIVESVSPLNEDAEILLSDVVLTGMTLEDASEEFVDLATESGYIDVDAEDNEVTIDVICENDGDKIQTRLQDRINNYFENNGIYGKVSKENLEEYRVEADALGITVQKLRLIYRAIEINPELTVDGLKDMSVTDLITIVKAKLAKYAFGTLKEDFLADKAVIDESYANMFTLQAEIAVLQADIAAFEGTDEDLSVLQTSLTEKTAAYTELKTAYDAAIEAKIAEYKAAYAEMRAEFQAQKAARQEQFRNRIQAHKQAFENAKETIKEQIKNYQNGKSAKN
jgi:hypothetical protein